METSSSTRHTVDGSTSLGDRFCIGNVDWPLAPETPPLQTSHPLPAEHTFSSTVCDGRRNLIDSVTSYLAPSQSKEAIAHAPTLPSRTAEVSSANLTSVDDLYGPERLFGPPLLSEDTGNSKLNTVFCHGNSTAVPNMAVTNPCPNLKEMLAREASNVTPGVDDTPYILYALDALTGDITTMGGSSPTESNSNADHSNFPYLHVPDDGLGYYEPRYFYMGGSTNIGTTSIKLPAVPSPAQIQWGHNHYPSAARFKSVNEPRKSQLASTQVSDQPRSSTTSSLSTLVYSGAQSLRTPLPANHAKDSWTYLQAENFTLRARHSVALPNFRPIVMQPLALGQLMLLCLLMAAALIFLALFSHMHGGLTQYSGSIYGAQFFLFRVLPQLLSVCILLFTQSLATTIIRIFPFSRMQALRSTDPQRRNGAIFDTIYPYSFLWPQLSRPMPWSIRIPLLVLWLANFTTPLQSSLFTVIWKNGQWQWATVQGVAWTLVVIYVCLGSAVVCVLVDWNGHFTGLIWDPRSIADLITFASNSNTMGDYKGCELLASRDDIRAVLRYHAIDKLGYWTWTDGRSSNVWHGIGTDFRDNFWLDAQCPNFDVGVGRNTAGSWNEKLRSRHDNMPATIDLEALMLSPHSENVRYRYLPWCLRDGPLYGFTMVSLLLLLAVFVVSFLPSTSIKRGFLPLVRVRPAAGAFSAANFLYSFLPALLGQILFLLFSSLDITLRILQPWAELANNAGGAQPEATILADYAACHPLQSAWHAAQNRHWRVVAVSLMTTCMAFLPALSGGVFMALTTATGQVRMVPNMALYAFVLALLALCLCSLISMFPGRHAFRLPHAVTSIAEILSFCADHDLLQEPAFKNAHSKATLLNQLGVGTSSVAKSRWIFGPGTSGDDRRLGIRRVRRYTELTNRPSGRRRPQPLATENV